MPTNKPKFSFAHLANDPDIGAWRLGQPKIGIAIGGTKMLTNEDLQEAYNQGFDEGTAKGEAFAETAYDDGYNIGYSDGTTEGYNDAEDAGCDNPACGGY